MSRDGVGVIKSKDIPTCQGQGPVGYGEKSFDPSKVFM